MPPPIDWQVPAFRTGPVGWLERLAGPGATGAELVLQFATATAAAAALALYAVLGGLEWTWWRILIACLLAFDLAGGAVTNATSSGKRYYHARFVGFGKKMWIVATHFAPLLVGWLYRDGDWIYGGALYGYALLAATIVLVVPLYLQRPTAVTLYLVVVIVSPHAFGSTPGFEWFVPLYFLKLLVSHLPREEPYRPDPSGIGGG